MRAEEMIAKMQSALERSGIDLSVSLSGHGRKRFIHIQDSEGHSYDCKSGRSSIMLYAIESGKARRKYAKLLESDWGLLKLLLIGFLMEDIKAKTDESILRTVVRTGEFTSAGKLMDAIGEQRPLIAKISMAGGRIKEAEKAERKSAKKARKQGNREV